MIIIELFLKIIYIIVPTIRYKKHSVHKKNYNNVNTAFVFSRISPCSKRLNEYYSKGTLLFLASNHKSNFQTTKDRRRREQI